VHPPAADIDEPARGRHLRRSVRNRWDRCRGPCSQRQAAAGRRASSG
jgi:hypothetical protein